jgi:hypothetical protein
MIKIDYLQFLILTVFNREFAKKESHQPKTVAGPQLMA